MTDEELKAIKERIKAWRSGCMTREELYKTVGDDNAALLAEVRRWKEKAIYWESMFQQKRDKG